MEIKVSVIIPVFNTEKFLEHCLNSIVQQELREIEIIVINDGSTDGSLKIIENFQQKDSRVILINNENKGVSYSRNIGISIAKGKYLSFIDSDDWIEKNFLEEMYKKAEDTDSDMIISDIFFDFKKNFKKNFILKDLKIEDDIFLTSKEYLNIFLDENFYGYMCNKLFKREIFIKANIRFDENIKILEDTEILLKLVSKMKKISKINKAFYHYIQYKKNSGISNEGFKLKVVSVDDCFNSIFKFFEKDEKIIKKIKINYILYCLFILVMDDENFRKEKFKKIFEETPLIEITKNKNIRKNKEKFLIIIFLKLFPLPMYIKEKILKKILKKFL